MTDLLVWPGVNPADPDGVDVVLVVDPDGDQSERIVAEIGAWGHEGDGALFIIPGDAWIERRVEGATLTVDVYVYEHLLRQLKVDLSAYPVRALVDERAVRVLSHSKEVDVELYAEAEPATAVYGAPTGTTPEEVVAAIADEEDWPMIFAPPPSPEELALRRR